MKNQIPIKQTAIIAASAIGAISIFLPWVSIPKELSVLGASSMNGITDNGGPGWIILILSAVSIVLAAINFKKELAQPYKIGISVAGGLSALIAIINMSGVSEYGFIASVGIGLILVLITGVASAVLPWLPIDKKAEKAEKTENNQK